MCCSICMGDEGAQKASKMLPPLERLSVTTRTGVHPAVKQRHVEVEEVREKVLGEPDLVRAVLGAIKVSDWRAACKMVKNWCALNHGHRAACARAVCKFLCARRGRIGGPLSSACVCLGRR